jgi:hypothetical protein
MHPRNVVRASVEGERGALPTLSDLLVDRVGKIAIAR